jgi:hypothetical protein
VFTAGMGDRLGGVEPICAVRAAHGIITPVAEHLDAAGVAVKVTLSRPSRRRS